MSGVKRLLRSLIDRFEIPFQLAFGFRGNPLAQLGALGWYFFWIVAGSGIYLYAFCDTGVTRAYQSVEALTHSQWWLGGVLRSLHRYASDALVVIVLVHMLREFAYDRLRGVRWFGWITGLILVAFIYACGITGYWMVWDRLAQYVAQTTTEWLDALPLFAEPLARNFLDGAHLSGRFFTLMAFLHIATPLLLLLGMWIHIQRHSRARVNPARELAISVFGMLLVLSLLRPALSQPPADLATVPGALPLDWFYLPAYPLVSLYGGVVVWLALLASGALLFLLPWLPKLKSAPPAVVHLGDCNGCARCFADCPFGAITMVTRNDGRAFAQQAAVDPALCISCGICVGACPTATPFRSAAALVPGIELPGAPLAALRDELIAATRGLTGRPRTVVFHCQPSAPVPAGDHGCLFVPVPCTAMVPPPFIDLLLSHGHAEGVLLAGCRRGECDCRLGDEWTEQRIARERDPQLRGRIPRDRIAVSWRGPGERAGRAADLEALRRHLAAAGAPAATGVAAWRAPGRQHAAWLRFALQGVALAAFAGLIAWLSFGPSFRQLAPGEAMLTLSFSHAGQLRHPCPKLTPGEMARLPVNMRLRTDCPRERWPVEVELRLDGRPLYQGTHSPAGLHADGPSTVYRRFAVPTGPHTIAVAMRDSGRKPGYDYQAASSIELKAAQSFVIDFDSSGRRFSLK